MVFYHFKIVGNRQPEKKKIYRLKKGKLLSNKLFQTQLGRNREQLWHCEDPLTVSRGENLQKIPPKRYHLSLDFHVQKSPQRKGVLVQNFPDPRAFPMRGDFFLFWGASFGRPIPTLVPFLWGGDFTVS